MNLAGCCSVVAQPGACLESACHVCIDVGPDVLYRLCILREVGKIETKITQTEAFASTPLSFVFFFAVAFLLRCLEGEAKQPAAQIQKQRACAESSFVILEQVNLPG